MPVSRQRHRDFTHARRIRQNQRRRQPASCVVAHDEPRHRQRGRDDSGWSPASRPPYSANRRRCETRKWFRPPSLARAHAPSPRHRQRQRTRVAERLIALGMARAPPAAALAPPATDDRRRRRLGDGTTSATAGWATYRRTAVTGPQRPAASPLRRVRQVARPRAPGIDRSPGRRHPPARSAA